MHTQRAGCDGKLERLRSIVTQIQPQTSQAGCENIDRDVCDIEKDIASSLSIIESSRSRLEKTLNLWQAYDDSHESLNVWLKDMDAKTRDYELKSSLEEKQEQNEKVADLGDEVIAKESDLVEFANEANELMKVVSEARIQSHVTQMSARYDSLLNTIKVRTHLLVVKWRTTGHVIG